MTAADIVAIITAVAAAVVAIIGAWRGENVRQQLQTHVQAPHPGPQVPKPSSSQD